MLNKAVHSKFFVFVEAAFLMSWLSNLANSDAMVCVYVLSCILGVLAIYDNYLHDFKLSLTQISVIFAVSVFASTSVIAANYRLFSPASDILVLFNLICSLLGGAFLVLNLLIFLFNRLTEDALTLFCGKSSDAARIFYISFFGICFIYFLLSILVI